jgi:branched-subunit amino acid transport protein
VTGAWVVVIAVGAATVALKALGPVALGGRELPRRVLAMLALLAPALLAALVIVQTLGGDRGLELDARLPGVAVAAVALLLRAPLLVAVVVAAATTALLRLAT